MSRLKSRQADLLRFLPAGVWYGVIWVFSAQDGAESQDVSDGVLGLFGYDILNSPMVLSDLLSFLIRKAAHMFVFFALTGFLVFGLWRLVEGSRRRGVYALLLCGALAAADECHQLFVPGRSGRVRDVCIDLAGGAVFLLCWYLLARLRKGKNRAKTR